MKTLPHLVGITLVALATGGLRAQTTPPGRSAEEVRAEAIAAARAPDQNGAASTRGSPITSSADPERVRQDAVETARAPDQNGAAGTRGFGDFKGEKDPALVAAEARDAAAASEQNVASGSKVNSKVISTMPAPSPMTAGK